MLPHKDTGPADRRPLKVASRGPLNAIALLLRLPLATRETIQCSSGRYYAIMYPLSFRWTRRRGPHIILTIWVVAGLLSSVQLVYGRAKEFTWAEETYYDCTEDWEVNAGKVYTAVIFTVTFLTPMLALTFTYSSIGWKMWRHTSPGNADPQRDQQQLSAKMKVVKMLATVVLMFAVCWLPIHMMNLVVYFDRDAMLPDTAEQEYLYIAAFFSCHWFSMANSFVNPIIYCFMSDNFRVDLRQLVLGCCPLLAMRAGGRPMGKRSSYGGGGSLPSSTMMLSSTTSSHHHQHHQRCNGFYTHSPTSVVALKTLGDCVAGEATTLRLPVYE
ncbi:substance-P receptor [Dermacentor silvarum]|nr:substance-P receptor [Dermacentor silvarum]